MTSEHSRTAQTLQQKFEALHEAFIAFNSEAANFQVDLGLNDKATRGELDALARSLAFCDQMGIAMTLMRDDLRALEPASAETLPSLWTDQLDECLEEWLRSACQTNTTIH